jgi:hypothetical protein
MVIPDKRSATRNPGFSSDFAFRLSLERRVKAFGKNLNSEENDLGKKQGALPERTAERHNRGSGPTGIAMVRMFF